METDIRKQELVIRDAPAMSESNELTRELALAREKGFFAGMVALCRLRWQAWLEERLQQPMQRRLEVRRELAESQARTVAAEHALDSARRGRLLAELEATAKQQTFTMQPEALPVTPYISQTDIEAMAAKALVVLGPEGSNEEQWQEYRGWLRENLPPNVATEVEEKIQNLRRMAQ